MCTMSSHMENINKKNRTDSGMGRVYKFDEGMLFKNNNTLCSCIIIYATSFH